MPVRFFVVVQERLHLCTHCFLQGLWSLYVVLLLLVRAVHGWSCTEQWPLPCDSSMFCIPEESGAPCFDRLGGASSSNANRRGNVFESVEVSPDVSARRETKRLTGIRAVKRTEIYTRALLLASESDELERARPLTPDPYCRTVSKRSWRR